VRIDSDSGIVVTGWNGREGGMTRDGIVGPGFFELDTGPVCLGQGDYLISAGIVEDIPTQAEESTLSYLHRAARISVRRRYRRELNYIFEAPGDWSLIAGENTEEQNHA